MNRSIFKAVLFIAYVAFFNPAATANQAGFSGESEASVVIINGLSQSETTGAKTKNIYTFENADNLSIFGKYLKASTKAADATVETETARNWEAGLRYEKSFTDFFNGFAQHKAESDPYNGIFLQRDSSDLGGKYFFSKTDTTLLFTEVGVRYSSQNPEFVDAKGNKKETTTAGRLYVEASHKFNESTSAKLWVEYIPDFQEKDFSYSTASASLSVAMNSILSLKTAFEIYHRELGPKKDTTTWTTALVARY